MAMKTKDKLLLLWILVVLTIGILLNHFCGGAIHALEHFVACGSASVPGLAKFAAGLISFPF
jgi:hypothetical protein